MTHYLTPQQQAELVKASKTPGSEADRIKAIDAVVEIIKLFNSRAFVPDALERQRTR